MTAKKRLFPGSKMDVEVLWDEENPPSQQILKAMQDHYIATGRMGSVVILGWETALALVDELGESKIEKYEDISIAVSMTADKNSVEIAERAYHLDILQALWRTRQ